MTPLTRAVLVYVPDRINVWLRFGEPLRVRASNRWRRIADFVPSSIFCRVGWQSGEFGAAVWRLEVLRAVGPGERVLRVAGVQPGAQVLLWAATPERVRRALQMIDAIEAQGIAPVNVVEDYWRVLHNRLAANFDAHVYTAAEHAATLRRRALEP
jgi:hypothetical protein